MHDNSGAAVDQEATEAVYELGLDRLVAMGVCDAEPFTEVREELERRKQSGQAASLTFTYNRPEVSTDVRASFPWAERIVVGAVSYVPASGSPGERAPGRGRVARFATEDHYAPLRSALSDIAAELTRRGRYAEVLVDDNRLVDRAAAVRAGLGWWGKSTMVLAPRFGPWILLGSVVTDARLQVSEPMERTCGTCVACIPACPTGAIVGPGVIDARLCLAAILQAPGPIPTELREAVGDRVYGCDDCLDACPPGERWLAAATEQKGRVSLTRLLTADDDELLAEFDHFYIPRRDPDYLRRNALVALGNTPGPGAEALIASYLDHPSELLREHASWALAALAQQC